MCPEKLLKTKEEYRCYAKNLRHRLDLLKIAQISNAICGIIAGISEYKNAEVVAGFYPFGKEIDLRQLYLDVSKKFLLPRVLDEKNIAFYPYDSSTVLEKNKWGVLEPVLQKETEPVIAAITPDIILLPALMADKKGYRLGYGRGYYDRYLAKLPGTCLKIVPVPDELFTDELPHDEFDLPADIVVTQSRVNVIASR